MPVNVGPFGRAARRPNVTKATFFRVWAVQTPELRASDGQAAADSGGAATQNP